MSSQGMFLPISHLHRRWQIYYYVPSKFVTPNVRYQTNACRRSRLLDGSRDDFSFTWNFNLNRPAEHIDALSSQLSLKLTPQHRTHHSTSHVSPTVTAYEDQNVLDIPHTVKQLAIHGLARQTVAMYWRQTVMRRVQLLREQEALRQRLDTVEGHPRQERHILEAGQQIDRRRDELGPPWNRRREGRVENGDVVKGLRGATRRDLPLAAIAPT